MDKSLRRCLYSFIILIGLLGTSFARDPFVPKRHQPLSMVIDDRVLIDSGERGSYETASPGNSIIKYDLNRKKREIITNEHIPLRVKCVASNARYIFVGGATGLGVYDKTKKAWSKWYEGRVNAISVNDSRAWLGTLEGVLEIDLNTKTFKKYTKENGLNENKVYSLFLMNDTLYAGTYRNGTGNGQEWKADMYGTGLNRIDLKTGSIEDVKLEDKNKGIVLDMYPVIGQPAIIRLVVGCWKAQLFDFDTKSNTYKMIDIKHHHIESILAKKGQSTDSRLADQIVAYLIGNGSDHKHFYGLPNPIAFEIVDILNTKQNYALLEKLMSSKDAHVKETVIWALEKIDSKRVTKYLLRALQDENEGVIRSAAGVLGRRKESAAVIPLKELIESDDHSKRLWALYALIEIDPEIVREIVAGGDDRKLKTLIRVIHLDGSKKQFVESIANDEQEEDDIQSKAKCLLQRL